MMLEEVDSPRGVSKPTIETRMSDKSQTSGVPGDTKVTDGIADPGLRDGAGGPGDQVDGVDLDADGGDGPGSPESSRPEPLEEENTEDTSLNDAQRLKAELSALNDRHLRLAAEFTNYRRRAETELSESRARGQADLLRRFLDGLDDLERVGAWQPDSATVEALAEGVDLVERKFRQALEVAGAEVLEPVGEEFDPNTMEAMVTVPTDSPGDDHRVHEVFQKGYLFKGHLVRPARVIVYKHEAGRNS